MSRKPSAVISFPCPTCGGRLETKDSRGTTYHNKPAVRRRRACRKCGARFTTFEAIDNGDQAALERVSGVMRQARTARDAIERLIEAYDKPEGSTTPA